LLTPSWHHIDPQLLLLLLLLLLLAARVGSNKNIDESML